MGFVIFVALGLYLLISIGVVVWAVSYANKRGKSAKRWALSAALVMYLILFWDWIPTVAVHQYYCAKDSGFWVYKTLDQWKAENPGVMEGLVEDKTTPMRRVGDDENHTDTQVLNQRFRWETEKYRIISLLSVYGWKREIVDSKTNDVIAHQIDFSSGEGRDSLKFWLNISECWNGTENRNILYHFVETIVNANKGEIK